MEEKYHYQSSWAHLQKEMPKVKLEEYVKESSKLTVLTWIANEQARANELKKIELLLYLDSTEISNADTEVKKKHDEVEELIKNV